MAAVRALLLVLAGVHAWEECTFPAFEHYVIDEGTGNSWAYAVTAMNNNMYLGGYLQGHFTLQGVTESTEVPPLKEAIYLGNPASKRITMYVSQTNAGGLNDKTWFFQTASYSSRWDKVLVRGLHHSIDGAHVIAVGTYTGVVTLPDGTSYDASGKAGFGNANFKVPWVSKLDVSTTAGIGPGTTGWFVNIDELGVGYPGGAEVYTGDGYANGDVLISFSGCDTYNATAMKGEDCQHYLARLAEGNGAEVWKTPMPAAFKQTGEVHGVPVFVEYEPCRLTESGDAYCAFKLDVNETTTFGALPTLGPDPEPKLGIVKIDGSGNFVWASLTLEATYVGALTVNKDGTVLAVSGWPAARATKPGFVARIDTSAGKEGEVMWSDGVGVGSHGIRDLAVTWDPAKAIQQIVGFGQIQGEVTITDVNGAVATLNNRGSYEVFIVSFTPDGVGKWAVDGGSEGLEYFFGLDMDQLSDDIVLAGAVSSQAENFHWGGIERPNSMYCPTGAAPIQSYKANGVKLSSTLVLPPCLDSCNSTKDLDVKAGSCYIDRYCYDDGEIARYADSKCLRCDVSESQTEWTGPNTTEYCWIQMGSAPGSEECVAAGTAKPVGYSTIDCLTCQPEVDENDWSVVDGFTYDGGKCEPITWQDRANAAGWVPCAASTSRMRRLSVKQPLPPPKAHMDEDDD